MAYWFLYTREVAGLLRQHLVRTVIGPWLIDIPAIPAGGPALTSELLCCAAARDMDELLVVELGDGCGIEFANDGASLLHDDDQYNQPGGPVTGIVWNRSERKVVGLAAFVKRDRPYGQCVDAVSPNSIVISWCVTIDIAEVSLRWKNAWPNFGSGNTPIEWKSAVCKERCGARKARVPSTQPSVLANAESIDCPNKYFEHPPAQPGHHAVEDAPVRLVGPRSRKPDAPGPLNAHDGVVNGASVDGRLAVIARRDAEIAIAKSQRL